MDFKTTTPILNVEQTKMFLKQMDLAFRLIDLKILKEIIERFELQHLEDTPEFLEDALEKFDVKSESETARIIEVYPMTQSVSPVCTANRLWAISSGFQLPAPAGPVSITTGILQ